jgi:Zn-dependent protease with chaperone function
MRVLLTGLIASVVGLSSCNDRSPLSEVKHNTNEPVRHESKSWMWANDSIDEYLAMGNPADPTSLKGPKKFLPTNHKVTKRLQKWIDELDAIVRSKDSERLTMVPKPIIHVEVTDDVNAFVTAIPVCFDNVQLRFDGSQNSGSRAPNKFLAVFDDGHFYGGSALEGQTPEQSTECRHEKLKLEELRERIATLNSVNDKCHLKVKTGSDDKFEVIANKNCVATGSLENSAGAGIFALMATSRHVTIFSGLLKVLGEAEAVSVLAHELGHYYRPHISSGTTGYNFAYDASGFNPSVRPTEKPGTQSLRQNGNQSRSSFGVMQARISDLSANVPASALFDVDGAALHPVTYPTLHTLVGLYSTSSVTVCEDAAKAQESLATKGVFDFDGLAIPFHKLDASESEDLLAWEKTALACLESIKVDDNTILPHPVDAVENATDSNRLAREGAKPIPSKGTMADWLKQMDKSIRHAYASRTFEPATEFSVQSLEYAQKTMAMAYFSSKVQAAELNSKKLGLYTTEQEADELAAEWMHALGFDSKTPGNVDMAFIKLFESDDAYNECNAKRATEWKDDDQSAVFVSWSDTLLDPHPAACYRVRDQDLEATAHEYTNSADGPRQVPDAQEWTDLVNAIPDSGSERRNFASHNVGSLGGIFKDIKVLGCRFDHHH